MTLPATFPSDLFTIKGDVGAITSTSKQFSDTATSEQDAASQLRKSLPPGWHGEERDIFEMILGGQVKTLEASAPRYAAAAHALSGFAAAISGLQGAMAKERPAAEACLAKAKADAATAAAAATRVASDVLTGKLPELAVDVQQANAASSAATASQAEWDAHVKTATTMRQEADNAARVCTQALLAQGFPPKAPGDTTTQCGPGDPAKGPLGLSDDEIRQQAKESAQSGVGDCYLLAALRGVAASDPNFIRTHMRFDPCTGHYQVQLYDDGLFGGNWKWVDVDPSSLVNGGVRGPGGQVDWMAIYEKAYAIDQGGDDKIGNGGNPGDAQKSITGKDSNGYWQGFGGKPSLDDLDKVLNQEHGSAVVGTADAKKSDILGIDTSSNGPQGDPKQVPVDKRLCPDHAYQVVSVDKQNGTVTLANPWGPNGGYADLSQRWGPDYKQVYFPGTVTLTKAEYDKYIQCGNSIGSTK